MQLWRQANEIWNTYYACTEKWQKSLIAARFRRFLVRLRLPLKLTNSTFTISLPVLECVLRITPVLMLIYWFNSDIACIGHGKGRDNAAIFSCDNGHVIATKNSALRKRLMKRFIRGTFICFQPKYHARKIIIWFRRLIVESSDPKWANSSPTEFISHCFKI